MDYELQSQLLVNALKEAEGQRAVRMPKATMQGNYAILPGAGNTLDAGFNRILGNYQKPQIEQRMADQSAMQQGEVDRLQSELANAPQGMDYTNPEQLTAENRRQMGIASQMQRLPMARKMAETMWAKGIGTPDRIAELQMRQIEAGNQRAKTLEEQARRDEANKTHALQMQANQLEAAKDRAAMLAAAKASGGGGPRDRFSVQTGPDNQMYRVNLETGQADPVTIRSALPNAVSAQQPGVGLTKPKPAMPTKAQDVQRGLQNLESGIGAYQQLLQGYDPASADALTDEKRATIGSAFTDLQMRMKEAYELGAITGPDMAVLQSAITDPTSLWGMTRGAVGGRKPFEAQITQQQAALARSKKNFEQQYGVVLPPPAGNVAVEPAKGATYKDPAKEARYREWLKGQGK
jgi:hypothetical protein